MIRDLLNEFGNVFAAMPSRHPRHRILKLLDEAIRRDVHFIDRHPTTFFQCMWNTGSWQAPEDSPDMGVAADETLNASALAWLLEDWRSDREMARVNGPWLRSLRPPASPLGGAQHASLIGHMMAITRLAYSPDGRLLASGGIDQVVRVWDTASARQLGMTQDLGASLWGIAFTPDNRKLVCSHLMSPKISVFDVETMACELFWQPHVLGTTAMALSSASGLLATSGSVSDRSVRLWDPITGDKLWSIETPNALTMSLDFSPNGE